VAGATRVLKMNPLPQSDIVLLERFVSRFAELSDLTFSPSIDFVAREFATGKVTEHGHEEWRPIHVVTDSSSLETLYSKLPARLPKLFEGLLLNYRWAEVDLDLFTLTANPLGEGLSRWLPEASGDNFLWDFLIRSGYIPFGKGPDIDYDRVCFDIATRRKGAECRIVKIDHEEVLCHERIKIVRELAPSFRSLVEQTIAHKKQR
jgi:hypothetical protein